MLLILLLLSACSGFSDKFNTKANLIVDSDQSETKLYVYDEKADDFKELDPLPYNKPIAELEEYFNEVLVLKVEKPGYTTEYATLTQIPKKSFSLKFKMKKIESWDDPNHVSTVTGVQNLSENLFGVFQLIQKSQYAKALEMTNSLGLKYPSNSFFYDLQAYLSIILGKKGDAIKFYEKSLQVNPSNLKAQKALSILKG